MSAFINMALRPDLKKIEESYTSVLNNWQKIDDELERSGIGRKDTPFDRMVMANMLSAWEYIDYVIRKKDYDLLSQKGGPDMLEVNHRVHYGLNTELRQEYRKAIDATTEKFTNQVGPLRKYYRKKIKNQASANKIAAGIYIAILGMPQLYIEGNHRAGSVVASWVNLVHNNAPFVLTVDNAISFFAPAQEIKKFDKYSTWRSLTKLPKYKKEFKRFWKDHCAMDFVR